MEKNYNKVAVTGRQLECRYAFVQFLYWSGYCALTGFVTIYLSFHDFSDSWIGYINSVCCVVAIIVSLILSDLCDRKSKTDFRVFLIGSLLLLALCLFMLVTVKLPVYLFILFYVFSYAISTSENGLLNALLMRYQDMGISVNFGWPRGVGSFGYALSAFVLGKVIEVYNPDLLILLSFVLTIFCVLALIKMPKSVLPKKITKRQTFGYRSLLKHNQVFALFLLAVILCGTAQTAGTTYLIRIVEHAGGGSSELGIALLIQSGAELVFMFLSEKICKRINILYLLQISFLFFFIKVLLLSIANSLIIVYLAMMTNLLCYGVFGIVSVLFVHQLLPQSDKVKGQSLTTICFTGGLGSILGNLIAGFVMDMMNLSTLLWISTCFAFVAFGVIVICCQKFKQNHNIKTVSVTNELK